MTLLRGKAEEGDGGGPPSDKQSAGGETAFESDGDENDEEDPLLLHSALAPSLHKQQTVIEVTACKTRTPSPAQEEGDTAAEAAAAAAGAASGTGFDLVVPLEIHLKWMEIHLYHCLYSSTITWQ